MAGRPPDGPEADEQGALALRDGHETLLPSVTRSALSTRSPVVAGLDPTGFQEVSETPVQGREPVCLAVHGSCGVGVWGID